VREDERGKKDQRERERERERFVVQNLRVSNGNELGNP